MRSREDEILYWRKNRERAIALREAERPQGLSSFDKVEFDYYDEFIARCDGRDVAFELVLELYVAVSYNPFPGEKMRLLEVATRLFPEVRIGFAPKVFFKKRAAWRAIFEEFELPPSQEVFFPVKEDAVDLEEVERKLLELAGGRFEVPLQEASSVLYWEARSKTYKSVKAGLEVKGWVWKCVKRSGKVVKVVCTPR